MRNRKVQTVFIFAYLSSLFLLMFTNEPVFAKYLSLADLRFCPTMALTSGLANSIPCTGVNANDVVSPVVFYIFSN